MFLVQLVTEKLQMNVQPAMKSTLHHRMELVLEILDGTIVTLPMVLSA